MTFLEHGFQTGNVWLPGLNIKVHFNQNQFFRYDGVVSDLNIHREKIFSELGASKEYEKIPQTYGITLTVDSPESRGTICFISRQDDIIDIFNWGHESVEALIAHGMPGVLTDELKKEGFGLNPFKKYGDKEDIAHIGGFLALHKKGKVHYVKDHPLLKNLWVDFTSSYQQGKYETNFRAHPKIQIIRYG